MTQIARRLLLAATSLTFLAAMVLVTHLAPLQPLITGGPLGRFPLPTTTTLPRPPTPSPTAAPPFTPTTAATVSPPLPGPGATRSAVTTPSVTASAAVTTPRVPVVHPPTTSVTAKHATPRASQAKSRSHWARRSRLVRR